MARAFLPDVVNIVSRLVAGIVVGYGAATAGAVLLSYALPLPRADAVLTAMMLSFALYTAAILAAFAIRSHARLWAWLLVPGGVCATAAWLIGPMTAP